MIPNYETIKQNVLLLSDIEDSPKIDLQIQALIDECLAYCYRKDVPDEMVLPLSDVIAQQLKMQGIIGVDGQLTGYKEGDMQISFNNGNINSNNVKYNGKLEPFKLVLGLQ